MYDLTKLCEKCAMPPEVTAIILSCPEEDTHGFRTLREHLLAACEAWEQYLRLGLSEEIYIDTMAAFSRFVREHKDSFGHYGFDRAFWTTRQTGCLLLRIGQLEYELCQEEGQRCIALHIPSDADLSLPQLRKSWEMAKPLLARIFPDYADVPWGCESWLLSQDLSQLLPDNSRILGFQRSFTIIPTEDDGEFKQWAYGRPDIPDAELPENTTLQRRLKNFLLTGNRFHAGRGILAADPFR